MKTLRPILSKIVLVFFAKCPDLPNLLALFEKKHHLVNFVGFIAVFFWCPHFDEDMGRNERWKEPS